MSSQEGTVRFEVLVSGDVRVFVTTPHGKTSVRSSHGQVTADEILRLARGLRCVTCKGTGKWSPGHSFHQVYASGEQRCVECNARVDTEDGCIAVPCPVCNGVVPATQGERKP